MSNPTGFEFDSGGLRKRVRFMAPGIARVTVIPAGQTFVERSLAVKAPPLAVQVTRDDSGPSSVLSAPELTVKVDGRTGDLAFERTDGAPIVRERPGGAHAFSPLPADGSGPAFQVEQHFVLSPLEALYGLGQFQNGYMNYRGKELLLVQANKVAIVPLLVSTHGYGILWDHYARSTFADDANGAHFTSAYPAKSITTSSRALTWMRSSGATAS